MKQSNKEFIKRKMVSFLSETMYVNSMYKDIPVYSWYSTESDVIGYLVGSADVESVGVAYENDDKDSGKCFNQIIYHYTTNKDTENKTTSDGKYFLTEMRGYVDSAALTNINPNIDIKSIYDFPYGDLVKVVNCNSYVSLRERADVNSRCIVQLEKGLEVRAVGQSGDFSECIANVDDNKFTGYVLTKYLMVLTKKDKFVVKCKESVTLREEPDTSAKEIMQVKKGETVQSLGNNGNFDLCYYNKRYGWILNSYLDVNSDFYGEDMTATNGYKFIPVYKQPCNKLDVIAQVPVGCVVHSVGTSADGKFNQIEYYKGTDGIWVYVYGWMLTATLTSNDGVEIMQPIKNCKFYFEPTTRSEGLGVIPKGTIVKSIGFYNGFNQVVCNGMIGWMQTDFLVAAEEPPIDDKQEEPFIPYLTDSAAEAIEWLAAMNIINSPDYWKEQARDGMEVDINDVHSLVVKISDFRFNLNTIGDSDAFRVALNNLVKMGAINTPDYWLNRKETFYDGMYVSNLIVQCVQKLKEALGVSSSKNNDIAFLEKQGLVNSPDYWTNNATSTGICDKESVQELLNRMAKALGSTSDRYNSNIHYLQEAGIIGDTSYWEDGSSTTGIGGDMSQNGYAEGKYVKTIIERFNKIFKERKGITDDSAISIPGISTSENWQPDIKSIHESLGIYVSTYQDAKLFDFYNRWRRLEYIDHLTGGNGYIFFTKPKLNFARSNLSKDRFFSNMSETIQGRNLLKNLTYDTTDTDPIPRSTRGVIKLLTNTAENFDTADVTLRSDITVETPKGYKYSMPGSEADTVTNGNFSINYTEQQDMSITLLHKAWIDYITHVRYGEFEPSEPARLQRYIDYSSSVYFFMVGEDGMTVKYFAKYTGEKELF